MPYPASSTLAEQAVLTRAAAGGMIDCRPLAVADSVVSAELLRAMLLGEREEQVHASGLYLAGVTVRGLLDLSFCSVGAPLRFRACTFTGAPLMMASRLAAAEFRDCRLPGLEVDGAHIDYLLSLDGSTVDKRVYLVRACIEGNLTAMGTHIGGTPQGALNATCARIGGSVHLGEGFKSSGPLILTGAKVSGDVDLDGAVITCEPTSDAVRLDRAEIFGMIHGRLQTVGTVRLTEATVGSDVALDGDMHTSDDGVVLSFTSAHIGGCIDLTGRFEGAVDGSGSTVNGVICAAATLQTQRSTALNLSGATLASNIDIRPGSTIVGSVNMVGAQIGGGVLVSGSSLSGGGEAALTLDFARVKENVDLQPGTEVRGGVRLVGAEVSGGLLAHGCHIEGAGREALTGDRSRIGGNVHLFDDVAVDGPTSLPAARIGGAMMLRSASLSADGRCALDLRLARMELGLVLNHSSIAGGIDLSDAVVGAIDDDLGQGVDRLGSWATATRLALSGFSYRTFAGDAGYDRVLRERWLRRTDRYDPGSWDQLAAVFRTFGRAEDARRIAIAGQRDRIVRGGLSRRGRLWRRCLGATIGYGYTPMLAGAWGLAIIGVFALLVWLNPGLFVPATRGAVTGASHPQPLVYAADVFLPIIDFHEADNWRVLQWMKAVQWLVIAFGWAISSIFVAGFTRVVRS